MEKNKNHLIERVKELEKENAVLKQQQIEINKAKELYLKIFEDFPALIWRSRLDMLCDHFNKTWLEFTGRTMEQEFGNGWTDGVHPEDFDFCLQTYVAAFEKRESFSMDYRMKNKYGEYRWIRDFGRPFYDVDNSFLGYIGSCYDITENKNFELDLVELNASKDKFFTIIAHDLISPFNTIIGFSEQLIGNIRNKDFESINKNADIILESSVRALDLLKNLLVWAQSQSGRMDFKPEIFELVDLINEMVKSACDTAGKKSIIIESELPLSLQVYADKAMISTVLRNLISNAIKFSMPAGKINILVVKNPTGLTVSISDNGTGIPNEKIKNLFNLNKNNSTPGTQNERGTGLGLVLCKEFIDKNKGDIWVESKVGVGSTFYFSIPVVQS